MITEQLFNKFLAGNCSPEEMDELLAQWDDPANALQLQGLIENALQSPDDHEVFSAEALKGFEEAAYRQLHTQLFPPEQTRRIGVRFRWLSAAAVLLVSIGIGTWIYLRTKSPAESGQAVVSKIVPGGNKATLTLDNGTRIDLSGAANGRIAVQSGASVTKSGAGQVVYQRDRNSDHPETGYNTVETPAGGQYVVQLEDGSKVWLNALSSLRYPVRFKNDRKVTLTGEGYFEVAHDKKHRFIVHSDRQDVEVLGTHFDVNSYGDEQDIKTTLLQGSIRISGANNGAVKVIAPGQQASLKENQIIISPTNAEYAVAWKDGYFRFNGKTLGVAMNEIARWYDVSVVFKRSQLRTEKLGGTVSKYADIKQVLNKIELLGVCKFAIEGRKVIVE